MSASTQQVPSNIDFASEVKSDRLNLLWKITAGLCVASVTLIIIFSASFELDLRIWVGVPAALAVSSMLTGYALGAEKLDLAALIYTFGGMVAIIVGLVSGHETSIQVLPYVFVIVVFIGGLLVSPQMTFVIASVSAVMTLAVPFAVLGNWDFLDVHQPFAIFLMFLSASLAAQVTGELYAITEWALQNYQRERRTNLDLFESRMELQKSLKRSQALSDKLKDTNIELKKAHEAAETAKQFRGQFLANMSHELRTPLNAIIGFSETMLKFPIMYDDEPLPNTYKNDMNQIYSSGRQLLHLINDILDLARVDAGKLEIYMQRVTLKPIIEMAQSTAMGLVGSKSITLHLDMPETLPDVWADADRVRQVLLNLYGNAVKFTEEGAVTLKVCETEDGLHFSLRDTGVGIAQEKLATIFEEFEQAQSEGRDPRAGSGLGLAISRQLLELMHGRIWAESVVGEGSTFHFVLQPYHKAKQATVEVETSTVTSTLPVEVPVVTSPSSASAQPTSEQEGT